jgi:hypothetical protein
MDFSGRLLYWAATTSILVDMVRYPNLTQLNGIDYFRRVIPENLRESYGKREELISLKARDVTEARLA